VAARMTMAILGWATDSTRHTDFATGGVGRIFIGLWEV